MVLVDTIWASIVYALMLVFAAIIGFIVLKVGIVSFKLAMRTIIAARGIENIKSVKKYPKYGITEENEAEFEIITSYIKTKIKKNYYANYYTKYAYNMFKIKTILSYIDSLKSFIKAKTEKNNYAKYAYIQLFKK